MIIETMKDAGESETVLYLPTNSDWSEERIEKVTTKFETLCTILEKFLDDNKRDFFGESKVQLADIMFFSQVSSFRNNKASPFPINKVLEASFDKFDLLKVWYKLMNDEFTDYLAARAPSPY